MIEAGDMGGTFGKGIVVAIFEWLKIIFHWCALIIVGGLVAIYFIVLFVAVIPKLCFSGTNSSQKLKKIAMRFLMIVFVVGIISLLIWVIPLAPKKDLVIVHKEIPILDGTEGTAPAYLVYYVWDGNREEHPWWVIHQRPLTHGGYEWAVLESADVGDVHDTDRFIEAMESASKFDKYWFKHSMHRVRRTRLQKLRHILFGGDIFDQEERVIKEVLNLIQSENQATNENR